MRTGRVPADPDARIAKMKDGRTHLAHKAEHAVDLSSGALVAITLQAGQTIGDTTTIENTLAGSAVGVRADQRARRRRAGGRQGLSQQ